jgi:GNAT superfamily N-acetyltransferase
MDFAHKDFELRPAGREDLPFAWALYKELMKPLTIELLTRWNEAGQKEVVECALQDEGTSIIVVNGVDAGWLQVSELSKSIYLAQLYLAPAVHNRGIGTAVVRKIMDQAPQAGKVITPGRDEE